MGGTGGPEKEVNMTLALAWTRSSVHVILHQSQDGRVPILHARELGLRQEKWFSQGYTQVTQT